LKRIALIALLMAVPLFAQEASRSVPATARLHIVEGMVLKSARLNSEMKTSWSEYIKADDKKLKSRAYDNVHRRVRLQIEVLKHMDEVLSVMTP
jgi:hypothetical protein